MGNESWLKRVNCSRRTSLFTMFTTLRHCIVAKFLSVAGNVSVKFYDFITVIIQFLAYIVQLLVKYVNTMAEVRIIILFNMKLSQLA